MSIFVFSQGKFVFAIFTLITNCTRDFSQISRMLRLLTKWRTLASDCVSLASRPGLSGLGKMVAQCTRIAYVVWRGLRLLTTWRKSFVSYASARVSMSKICNRYLAKIDIWYNSNLCRRRELSNNGQRKHKSDAHAHNTSTQISCVAHSSFVVRIRQS